MSQNKIPNELRVDLVDDGQGQSQWVETRVIDPVAGASQKQVRFLLPKEGILDDAYLTFAVQVPNADHYLPLWAGAMSAFETATLMCGGEVMAQSRGINHLWTLKNFYRDPENRDNKQSKRVGSETSIMVDTKAAAGATDVGAWGVDTNQDSIYAPTDTTRLVASGYRPTTDDATTPTWEVKLQELFPILYQTNLPLGLLKDQVSIVINLQDEQVRGDRSICSVAGGWVSGTQYNRFQLNVDLVFYEDPIDQETTMDKLQRKLDAGLSLPFTDYTYVQKHVPAGTVGSLQKDQTLLGLDHQIVRRILMATPLAPNYSSPTSSGNSLLGNYCSLGSNQQNTLQVTINSEPYYPSPLDTDGKIQNQLSQCYAMTHKINQAIQSAVGQVDANGAYQAALRFITDKTLNGNNQADQEGYGHYYGIPLCRSFANVPGEGTAVGRQSVLLELGDMKVAENNNPKTLHIWAECERNLLMANGKVLVTGA